MSPGLLTLGLLQRCGPGGDLSFLIHYDLGSLLQHLHQLTSNRSDFHKECIKKSTCQIIRHFAMRWQTAWCNLPKDQKNRGVAGKLETTKDREQFLKIGSRWVLQWEPSERGADPGQVLEQEDPCAFGTEDELQEPTKAHKEQIPIHVNALHESSHLALTIILSTIYYSCFHFTDEQTEAQRVWITCPMSLAMRSEAKSQI